MLSGRPGGSEHSNDECDDDRTAFGRVSAAFARREYHELAVVLKSDIELCHALREQLDLVEGVPKGLHHGPQHQHQDSDEPRQYEKNCDV
mgnify:CR=1 FL=1